MIEILTTVGISLLFLLLGIIGFFLRQFWKGTKDMKVSLTDLRLDVKLYNAELSRNRKDLIRLEIKTEKNEDNIADNKLEITKLHANQENCQFRK